MPQGKKIGPGKTAVPYNNPNKPPVYDNMQKRDTAKPKAKPMMIPSPGGGRMDASGFPKPSISAEDSAFIQRMHENTYKPKGKKK